jgi:hypothetical protein
MYESSPWIRLTTLPYSVKICQSVGERYQLDSETEVYGANKVEPLIGRLAWRQRSANQTG